MLLFDAHLDLAWNAIDWKRDLEWETAAIRASEAGRTGAGWGGNTVSLPELRRAGVGVCVATLLARLHHPGNPMLGYTTAEAVHGVAWGQLAYYQAMARRGKITLLLTKGDLRRHVAAWTQKPAETPLGVILSMEGADPIVEPGDLSDWYAAGIRTLGLTHYGQNRYGGGTECTAGLAPSAKALLQNIETLAMPLDTTHLSDAAFWETMELFGGRVLASHQNCRRWVDHQRQFSDAMIKAVVERRGVLGVALDAWMLQPGWVRGKSKPEVTLERVVDNIDHICQVAGSVDCAGVGSDLDGGFGKEQTPVDVDTIADLARLPELLTRRGYSDVAVKAVMHGNWLRFFDDALPE